MSDAILSTDALTKKFGAITACNDVSINLIPGEVHAIIGPNGAGKSTLIAQICGSLKPTSGTVEFLGQDVTGLSARERSRNGLGRTFQISALVLEDTVLQNAMLGVLGTTGNPWKFFRPILKDKQLRQSAEDCLSQVGLSEYLQKRTAELSHGQRRQLEIGMALTLSPKAFIMDEPMAGLGYEGSMQLTEILRELKKQAPILLVEHDMDAVFSLADRVSVLVNGKVITTGTVDEIRNDRAVREAYLGQDA